MNEHKDPEQERLEIREELSEETGAEDDETARPARSL
jgi:hypothetical protein